MSFFPLWKLKGHEPTKTPTVQVAHLKEDDADKEECTDTKGPDGMDGIAKEFIVLLARAVKDAQQEQQCCYHFSSQDHFIWACPLVVASRTGSHLNWKDGMVPAKGVQTPPGKVTMPKVPQDGMPKA